MTAGPNRLTYAHELYELLRWFGRLRWVAAASLIVASLAGPRFGIEHMWPGFFCLGLAVATYNLGFAWVLRRPVREDHPLARQRIWAVTEILVDLGTLLVATHLTGGLLSPILPFFVFHMAIGTMLLSNRTMYAIAGITCLSILALYLAEGSGILPWRPIDPNMTVGYRGFDYNMLSVIITVFVVVYLTGRVTRESKQLNIQLSATARQLRGKTGQLEAALAGIAEVERRKSHYMRISAHQLRSPLATIKASLQVMTQGYCDPVSARGQKLLGGTVDRVNGLLEIVTDLLELAKIREGRANAPWTRNVDLSQLLEDTVVAAVPATERSRVHYVRETPGPVILAWGVPPDLRFAVENLISNAVKYSPAESEVNVVLKIVGNAAVMVVADRGIGIPEDLHRDVFLEFVRAPNAKHHTFQGTGLGLSIAKEAFEMHGGRISLASQVGVGTTFTVEMPLDTVLPDGVTVQAQEQDDSPAASTDPGAPAAS